MKERIFRIIQIGNKEDIPSRTFDIFIATVIILNIVSMFLETFSQLDRFQYLFGAIENVTLLIFCIEYLLRIWTSDLLYPDVNKGKAVLKFLISFDGIIDLLTILPFFFLTGFVAFRMLRVVRIFHLFRINIQYDSFNVITSVLKEKANQIISSVFIIIMLMLAASIGIYSAENPVQPDKFENAFSGIWWSVSAVLTVGYGDIYPITLAGKIMAIITSFLGVGVVAIPTGIISAGFVEHYSKLKQLNALNNESSLNFVTIRINKKHDWKNLLISDTHLPAGIAIALIIRGEDVIIPKGDVRIQENDRVILAAEMYVDEMGLKLTERIIDEDDDWVDLRVCDLDISRLTTIVSIQRRHAMIIPTGDTHIREGDKVILYTKKVNPKK